MAILQISGFERPAVELGNSNDLRVGEPVFALGSPHGLQGTITSGIVSSVRDVPDGGFRADSDRCGGQSRGNSGGPLLNSKGLVIGVISWKLRGTEGLNFAVPINYVRGMLGNLQQPMTLDSMRSALAGSVDVFRAASGFPANWKSMTSGGSPS